ncbi:hypothetical protein GCM10020218_001650 [Dactylosporangium vinaceum]
MRRVGDTLSAVTDLDEFRARSRLLAEVARPMVAAGADADAIAAELLRTSGSPIIAIRAIAEAMSLGIGDAKWIVHRNLDPEVRQATERLWDEAIDALQQAEHPPAEDEPAS